MLSKSLALELGNTNIMVNEIAPGIVSGGLSKKNQQENADLLKTHLNSIPVHSLITVEEIAQQVLWMSDFENKNMTGLTVTIDGGLSLTSKMTP
jgi:NAD(P)-dependent dehydrogenase (short-subunit alcohol dehydrogenase family)